MGPKESGVGALVHAADIPISKPTLSAARALGLDPFDSALFGGEDYELVFSFPRDRLETVSGALVSLGRHLHVVGKVVSYEEGVRLVLASGEVMVLARAGFDRFAVGAS
ncbi:MAG: hypothetical protein ACM3ZU_00055 [Bacteroidota bacterium]